MAADSAGERSRVANPGGGPVLGVSIVETIVLPTHTNKGIMRTTRYWILNTLYHPRHILEQTLNP